MAGIHASQRHRSVRIDCAGDIEHEEIRRCASKGKIGVVNVLDTDHIQPTVACEYGVVWQAGEGLRGRGCETGDECRNCQSISSHLCGLTSGNRYQLPGCHWNLKVRSQVP